MDLDARGVVPGPWQFLLRTLFVRLVRHALNDDGAPDGTSILRALSVVWGEAADGIRTHDLLHGKQTL
jgi:hypothetical protein